MGLRLLQQEKGPCCLVVTGKATDLEFNEQIRRHKADRNPGIPVVESDVNLGQCLRSLHLTADAVLVDSVDFWVFNVFTKKHPDEYIQDFFASLEVWRNKRLILVSAEIGLGPLPSSGFTRRFSRLLGEVNQGLAAMCEDVTLIVAGLPVRIR